MRKSALTSLAITAILAVAASLAWAGGDVWKTKPYQQWDQKDIQQILTNSPWVKVQSVAATWRGANLLQMGPGGEGGETGPPGGEGAEGAGGGGAGGGAGARGSMGAGSAPGGAEGSPEEVGGMGEGGEPRMASFIVRWNSAQTIREALARSALLSNKVDEADAARFVGQTPTDYEIFIGGQDLSPFASVSDNELKAKSYLEAKQSKHKIAPNSVTVKRTPDNKRVVFVMFSFPRPAAGDQSFVTPKDKNVEFSCKLKNLDLRANFDLHKMVTEKGQDL
jgi:hypothetical protein